MNNEQQARIDAEQEAKSDAVRILWFFVGLVLSILGVLVAYIYQQAPPASRFLDKSQEWTVLYSDAYKTKLRHIQVKYSVIGSVIGFFISGVLLAIYILFLLSLYSRFENLSY